ncbi:hypothetical protein HOD29_05110 [archaeon]|jgi:hypothetical protein|nr:hypothetical protein [archaeon]
MKKLAFILAAILVLSSCEKRKYEDTVKLKIPYENTLIIMSGIDLGGYEKGDTICITMIDSEHHKEWYTTEKLISANYMKDTIFTQRWRGDSKFYTFIVRRAVLLESPYINQSNSK